MINVVYHGPACADGFAAAWVINQAFQEDLNFFPTNYNDPFPKLEDGPVFILDFSFPRDTMLDLLSERQVVCLDHHKTAQATLSDIPVDLMSKNNSTIIFDMTKCGSVLTWEYFFSGQKLPTLLEYIQDRDLWKWKLPYSREISAALDLTERNFLAWKWFNDSLSNENGHNDIVVGGTTILKYIQQKVKSLAEKAEFDTYGGYIVKSVNSPLWQSEIGEAICVMNPDIAFSAVYFMKGNEKIVSLRTKTDFDVSAIAAKYGGGGHAAAAGFTLKLG